MMSCEQLPVLYIDLTLKDELMLFTEFVLLYVYVNWASVISYWLIWTGEQPC